VQTHENTGWRKISPAIALVAQAPDEVSRNELFAAGRLAVQALALKPALRFVLDQLVGCYQGEPIQGRLLVWPSNEFLMERTGLSERTIRYAIKGLIDRGVVTSKDSPNGKRYARRARSGQIIDAYGLDLSPIVARKAEFGALVERLKVRREAIEHLFDEITICRRSVRELILAIQEWEAPADDLESAFEAEQGQTPRRNANVAPDASLARWQALKAQAEERYKAACAGKNCPLKENNNDSPDQSCNKGPRDNGEAPAVPNLIDLAAACPDAFALAGEVENSRDLVRAAGRLRGTYGTHESAWSEACEKLGPVAAAVAFFLVLQAYDDDGGKKIRNFGGYFRTYARMVGDGRIELVEEIRALRRRRAH
jgi:replication initiation protein RepC